MKRSHLVRLPDSDVFSVPKSLGLQALRRSSITAGGMELNGLHPLSCRYAQNTIGEIPVFTDWVQKVLSLNGELPTRHYWSESTKNWEKGLREQYGK